MSAGGAAPQVAVLMPCRDVGGHEIALLGWLADAVRQHGLTLRIDAPAPRVAEACAAAGLAVQRASPVSGKGRSPRQWLSALRQVPPGTPVLLAPGVPHAAAWLLVAGVLLRRRLWVYLPMTGTAVELGYPQGALRDRLLAPWLRRVAAWITIDERQAQTLRERWQVSAPVHVLPNLARVGAVPARPPARAADGRLRVAYVGRFHAAQKGLDWLIDQLRADRSWTQDFRWLFQGRGQAELALLELAAELGPQHVEVRPHAPIQDALRDCDVLLLPSRYEGLPLVALEATALGWPVVATDRSNLQDLLPPGSLYCFGDAAGLRQALQGLAHAEHRSAAVAHARARWQGGGSEARYAQALAGVVHALAGAREAAPAC